MRQNLTYINELKLLGKSDKTIECYSRALRQTADFFDTCPDDLSVEDLKRYFLYLVDNKSWSAVKIARNAIQFCYKHILHRPYKPIKFDLSIFAYWMTFSFAIHKRWGVLNINVVIVKRFNKITHLVVIAIVQVVSNIIICSGCSTSNKGYYQLNIT